MTEQERVEALRELESRNIFLKSEIEQNLQYYPELAHYIYGNQPLSDSLKSTGERLKAYMEEVAMNDNEIFELKLLDPNKPIVKRDYKHEIKQTYIKRGFINALNKNGGHVVEPYYLYNELKNKVTWKDFVASMCIKIAFLCAF